MGRMLSINNLPTGLSSIESQPEKVVVVVVVVGLVFVGVVVVIIAGHKNLTLRFGQNRVDNKKFIVNVVDTDT